MRTLSKIMFCALGLSACNWTEFDDLKDTTSVSVIGKPSGSKSSDVGVALVRGQQTSGASEGGTFVTYGTNKPFMYRITVDAKGAEKYKSKVDLTELFGFSNIEASPTVIANPITDDVALVTKTLADQIGVLENDTSDNVTNKQIFELANVNAAAYILTPGIVSGEMPGYRAIVAGSNSDAQSVLEREISSAEGDTPKCILDDGATPRNPVAVRGIAGVMVSHAAETDPAKIYDDVVVWTTAGKLLVYDGRVIKGQVQNLTVNTDTTCPADPVVPPMVPLTEGHSGPLAGRVLDTGFMPGLGSQLIRYKDHYVIAIGHKDTAADTASFIQVFDIAGTGAPTVVGTPVNTAGLKSAAVLTTSAGDFLVAGYPFTDADGKQNAGMLQVYGLSETGVDATPMQSIAPPSPGTNNNFGRAVTAFSFNGEQTIVVGEVNNVYTYFTTALYSDAREK
ncbi:MAG TPA: hypothetical protein VGM39_09675 [Kofleriaceae bacterium]|jgi:hypothetical protein